MAFTTVNLSGNGRPYPASNQSVNPSSPLIDQAFGGDWTLRQRIYEAMAVTPQYASLFEDIGRYIVDTTTRTQSNLAATQRPPPLAEEEPVTKKRRLQNGNGIGAQSAESELVSNAPLKFRVQDVSFAIPQRKKLTLEITTAGGHLRARNQSTNAVEFGIAMSDIEHILCLPVPEKNQRQFNFCVIPKYSDGITSAKADATIPECIQWTVNDGAPKGAFYGNGQQVNPDCERTIEDLIRNTLNEVIAHTNVIRPDDREFVSAMPEAHRQKEKAYHAKAFRGSKEGYLFFLSTGIFFGFKKPLLFFGFETIESISFTSVLQRTFNLNVVTRPSSSDEAQEIEFSMIDQANFLSIGAYVKKHGLQDASLAEDRRAKKLNINSEKRKGDEADEGEEETGETELEKAQRELEDQEDEEEEDYDPGDEDDSDGSGSSSEEEDSVYVQDKEFADDAARDLVKEELGSEAEELSGE